MKRTIAAMLLFVASLTAQTAEIRVWANTTSGIYHCQGDKRYGVQNKTQAYVEITITEAHNKGYSPARGKECVK